MRGFGKAGAVGQDAKRYVNMTKVIYMVFPLCLAATILAVVFYFRLSERKASSTEFAAIWLISRLIRLIAVACARAAAVSALCKWSGSNVLYGSSGARFLMLIVGSVSQSASRRTIQY
jgi:hypothetical protein